ncbi:MAG: murein hydrolase activator EnvC [Novosphingobium sp.]
MKVPTIPLLGAVLLLTMLATVAGTAQQATVYDDPEELRQALDEARIQGQQARERAERLEAEAAQASEAAERTERESASIAARIQQSQADMAAQQANIGLIEQQRMVLRARLAEKQRPLAGLTASLQRLSRRPPILSLLRQGSLQETVYLRAMLASMLPEVERRTAVLRSELSRGKALEEQSRQAVAGLRAGQGELWRQREALIALETRQRLESRSAGGIADREAERALAFAEQARDLDALSDSLDKAGSLREALARLPGPILRPQRPQDAQVSMADPQPSPPAGMTTYVMPVAGRLIAGFGEARQGQPLSRGIVLATRQGAQVVAPAAGRVAFAGPFRGYGAIVIVEHTGGWTSLITGLAQLDTRVGDTLVAGSPLGIAGAGSPQISLELRRNGEPVNPLEYIKAL